MKPEPTAAPASPRRRNARERADDTPTWMESHPLPADGDAPVLGGPVTVPSVIACNPGDPVIETMQHGYYFL